MMSDPIFLYINSVGEGIMYPMHVGFPMKQKHWLRHVYLRVIHTKNPELYLSIKHGCESLLGNRAD